MEELINQMKTFFREREWEQYHSPKNLAMNLSIEAAEILEHFLWLSDEKSYNLDSKTLSEVRDEIGDVFLCLLNLANSLGINPLEAAKQKLVKIGERYPADQCKGKSLKYTAYQHQSEKIN